MSVSVEIAALEKLQGYFERLPDVSSKAASLAINRIASRDALSLSAESIMEQVAFPKDYLKGNKLEVARLSTPSNLEAVIRARQRPTSLARFAPGQPLGPLRKGATLAVKVKTGGGTKALRAAWLVKLKKGRSLTEDNFNVGLAVRVKAGDVTNKWSTHTSWFKKPDDKGNGIALLYGPSVDQIFRDVADKIAEPLGELVADEFFRQFARLA